MAEKTSRRSGPGPGAVGPGSRQPDVDEEGAEDERGAEGEAGPAGAPARSPRDNDEAAAFSRLSRLSDDVHRAEEEEPEQPAAPA